MTSQPLSKSKAAKIGSTITLLAGIWLFISPWVYATFALPNAWNNWIVGALLIIFAAIRLASPPTMSWLSWVNCALGVRTLFSPWIYGYAANSDRFVNSLILGIIVFIFAITSATAVPRIAHPGTHQPQM